VSRVISQWRKELIGRRVRQEMEKRGWTLDTLYHRTTQWSIDRLSHLIEGQPLWLSRSMIVDLVLALNLTEGRDVKIESLSDEDLESLLYPIPPEQPKLNL